MFIKLVRPSESVEAVLGWNQLVKVVVGFTPPDAAYYKNFLKIECRSGDQTREYIVCGQGIVLYISEQSYRIHFCSSWSMATAVGLWSSRSCRIGPGPCAFLPTANTSSWSVPPPNSDLHCTIAANGLLILDSFETLKNILTSRYFFLNDFEKIFIEVHLRVFCFTIRMALKFRRMISL